MTIHSMTAFIFPTNWRIMDDSKRQDKKTICIEEGLQYSDSLEVKLQQQMWLSHLLVATWNLQFYTELVRAYNSPCSNLGSTLRQQESPSLKTMPILLDRQNLISHSRRSVISIPFWFFWIHPQNSMADSTAVEALRRSASKVPGYGEADIYFPREFLGKWSVTRIISTWNDSGFVDGSLPLLSLAGHRKIKQRLPIDLKYSIRFIPVGGNVDKVVADRAFNERSFYEALLKLLFDVDDINNITASERTIQDIQWSDTNPNVLSTLYNDGSLREIKVTKRATSMDDKEGFVSSSEYRRITASLNTIDGRNLPSISASRVLTKWKLVDSEGIVVEDRIDGIELIYTDGIMGDPLGGDRNVQSATAQPTLVSKSILRLTKTKATS